MRGLRVGLAVSVVSVVVSVGAATVPALAAKTAETTRPAKTTDCVDTSVALTIEEQRLTKAVPQEILQRSGFDALAPRFARALCGAESYREAKRIVTEHGRRLWRRAVDRAQGRGLAGGDLSRDDDRPLYWARLGMTGALRRWRPEFTLSDAGRTALLDGLERGSRGQDSIRFPGGKGGKGAKRVLVTGFDPFTLDRDIRISNPSGAVALALDGVTVRTDAGPVRFETVTFPVRWGDFAQGTVERTLRPHLPKADLFATVSQGRVGRIDVERFNGAWRGGFPDNENLSSTGLIPVTVPDRQPQWTVTTLPYRDILAASTGRFPVYANTQVTEIPAGAADPVVRPDGPTEGSTARAGGGGNYLSNEIAYRATLLRDRLGLDIPGGHVHTPVLQFGAGNTDPATGTVTDPEFTRNRRDIVGQVRSIILVAARADAPGRSRSHPA